MKVLVESKTKHETITQEATKKILRQIALSGSSCCRGGV